MTLRSIIFSIETTELKKIVQESTNIMMVLNKLNLSGRGHSYDFIKKRFKMDSIDISHFIKSKSSKYENIKDVLIENSPYKNNSSLRIRLIEEGLLKNICSNCNQLPFHNGKELTLQMDHKNGNPTDNRIENLRIICPNCHTQTDNYGRKNR